MRVKNDRSEIPRLAEEVIRFCERHGMDPSLEADINLVLEEAVINVMAHGYADDGEHEIAVFLESDGFQLTIKIEDDGVAFNPLDAPEARLDAPIEERRPGGVGVFLMKQLMDELHYCRLGSKNILVMKKNQ